MFVINGSGVRAKFQRAVRKLVYINIFAMGHGKPGEGRPREVAARNLDERMRQSEMAARRLHETDPAQLFEAFIPNQAEALHEEKAMSAHHARQTKLVTDRMQKLVTELSDDLKQVRGERDQALPQLQQAKEDLENERKGGKTLKDARALSTERGKQNMRMRKEIEELKNALDATTHQLWDAKKELDLHRKQAFSESEQRKIRQELLRTAIDNMHVAKMADVYDAERKQKNKKRKEMPPYPDSDDD